MPGRHASDSSAGFYRDLAMMVVGILLVGAAVFILLYLVAGNGSDPVLPTSTTAGDVTTSSTTEPAARSTTEAPTSTVTTAPESTTSTVPVRPPSEVTVVVLNSIGIQGVAGRLTQDLADNGYQVLEASNYEPELEPSRIWYREGYSAEANELLEFVPGAEVEALPEEELEPGANVVIILGTGYDE